MEIKKTIRMEPLGFVEEEEVILQGEEPRVPHPMSAEYADDGDCGDPCRYTPAERMRGQKATERQLLYVLLLTREADSLSEEQKARIFQHLLEGDKWMISKVIHKLKFHS